MEKFTILFHSYKIIVLSSIYKNKYRYLKNILINYFSYFII